MAAASRSASLLGVGWIRLDACAPFGPTLDSGNRAELVKRAAIESQQHVGEVLFHGQVQPCFLLPNGGRRCLRSKTAVN